MKQRPGGVNLCTFAAIARIRRPTRRKFFNLSLAAALGLSSILGIHTGSAQVTILHSFADGTITNDGALPTGLILAPDGNFYGSTSEQVMRLSSVGARSTTDHSVTLLPLYGDIFVPNGTLFRLKPGGQLTIIHRLSPHGRSVLGAPLF
jgi:hypothetical protein